MVSEKVKVAILLNCYQKIIFTIIHSAFGYILETDNCSYSEQILIECFLSYFFSLRQ